MSVIQSIGPTSKASKKEGNVFITFTNVFFNFLDKKRVFNVFQYFFLTFITSMLLPI